MKKILLTAFMAVTTVVAMAETKNYTDNLVVTINDEAAEPQETTIIVEKNSDGTYNLSLNKFTLGGTIKVGNIVLNNIAATEENGIANITADQTIQIAAGDENVDDWMGPMLGDVPVKLTGKLNNEKLYCTIDIDMISTLGQMVYVVFGSDDFGASVVETKNYTDNLVVTINDEAAEPQETTIIVEKNSDGTYNLSLNKFTLGGMIKVGNIVLNNIAATEENGIINITADQTIQIAAGDENVDDWMGPMLGDVPVKLTGKLNDEKLYCTIDIDMISTLGQMVYVVFGSDITTGIENVITENYSQAIYDITGREVNKIETAGIYIINGKKVFVK